MAPYILPHVASDNKTPTPTPTPVRKTLPFTNPYTAPRESTNVDRQNTELTVSIERSNALLKQAKKLKSASFEEKQKFMQELMKDDVGKLIIDDVRKIFGGSSAEVAKLVNKKDFSFADIATVLKNTAKDPKTKKVKEGFAFEINDKMPMRQPPLSSIVHIKTGEYEFPDGTTVRFKDGKIVSLRDPYDVKTEYNQFAKYR